MRNDNRGLSLFELMVVVAMLGVLMGVGVVCINSMLGRPAQECAQKIAYSLERHRTTATSKVDASYKLYIHDGDLYLDEYVNNTSNPAAGGVTTTKLGSTVTVKCTVGDSTRILNGGAPLVLQYDRSSGSFKKVDGAYCTKITVSRAGRVCEVNLEPITGKVYLY